MSTIEVQSWCENWCSCASFLAYFNIWDIISPHPLFLSEHCNEYLCRRQQRFEIQIRFPGGIMGGQMFLLTAWCLKPNLLATIKRKGRWEPTHIYALRPNMTSGFEDCRMNIWIEMQVKHGWKLLYVNPEHEQYETVDHIRRKDRLWPVRRRLTMLLVLGHVICSLMNTSAESHSSCINERHHNC